MDVNAVASHIADADIFDMVNYISANNYEDAVRILSELMDNKDNSAISIVSSISYQYRRLYAAKVIQSRKELMDILGIKYDFIADNLIKSSRLLSTDKISNSIRNCCDIEYRMKSSGSDDTALVKSLLIELWKN